MLTVLVLGQRKNRNNGFNNFFHALMQIIHDQAQAAKDGLNDPVVGWLVDKVAAM